MLIVPSFLGASASDYLVATSSKSSFSYLSYDSSGSFSISPVGLGKVAFSSAYFYGAVCYIVIGML